VWRIKPGKIRQREFSRRGGSIANDITALIKRRHRNRYNVAVLAFREAGSMALIRELVASGSARFDPEPNSWRSTSRRWWISATDATVVLRCSSWRGSLFTSDAPTERKLGQTPLAFLPSQAPCQPDAKALCIDQKSSSSARAANRTSARAGSTRVGL